MLALVFSPLFAAMLLLGGYTTQMTLRVPSKGLAYECGFIATEGQVWKPYMISFFVVGLLFLLFDLELLWVFPLSAKGANTLGNFCALFFFNFVVTSLLYEIVISATNQA